MKELLELQDVHIILKKGDIPLVKGVDLSVCRGKATVIVGESGSGKTMLLKAIVGILNRKNVEIQGRAYFEGTDLFSLPEKARRGYCSKLALIMQNPMTAFDPSVKIGRQMVEGIRDSKPEARKKAAWALEAVGLSPAHPVLQAYPHELSGGMLQRVMIAIAVMGEASLIVADEPTTALDTVNQNLVLDEMNALKRKGVGVLFVTHDFVVAEKIADRIAVMKDGRLVETGKAETILNAPRHDFTKTLIEASFFHRRGVRAC